MIFRHRISIVALRNEAPNGARFDNPGRSPGYATKVLPAPTGRDSHCWRASLGARNFAPLGLLRLSVQSTQGFAALRPGLSNLAPFGAFTRRSK